MKIDINDLRKVKGIGGKTLERIREQFDESEYVSKYNTQLHLDENSINHGDCLELMNGIPDKSVDMILADLPYGTTACKWDSIISLDKLWKQYNRIIKDDGAIVLFSGEPFTSELIQSNIDNFKYKWIWDKVTARGHLVAKIRPMQQTEEICVFGNNKIKYNPIMVDRPKDKIEVRKTREYKRTKIVGGKKGILKEKVYDQWYPKNLLTFSNASSSLNSIHPTQKPIELLEYLIKTYTDENDIVLDNVSGSGSTAIACVNTNRKYICIEKNKQYYDKSVERINNLNKEV